MGELFRRAIDVVLQYHTGYRAFSRAVLERLPLEINSDGFLFDNQMLLQVIWYDYRIGEVSCPTHYAADASSISFVRSVGYGFGCLKPACECVLAKMGVVHSRRFPPSRGVPESAESGGGEP